MKAEEKGGAHLTCFARQKDDACAILDLGCKASPEICAKCRFRKPQREVTNGVTYLKKVQKKPLGKAGRKKKTVLTPKPKPAMNLWAQNPKPYCSTCVYSEGSGTGGTVCMYIAKTGKRRGCESSQCKEMGRYKPIEGERLSGWARVAAAGRKKLRSVEAVLPVIADDDYLAEARRIAEMIAAGGKEDVN